MDVKTLEHHHNALQIFVNHLVLSLATAAPQVVWDTLAAMRHTLDTTPEIPAQQRQIMEGVVQVFTEHMTDQSRGE